MVRALKAAVALALLGWAGWQLLPASWELGNRAWGAAETYWGDVSATTFAERQARAYGDCGGLGYGYVNRILLLMPEPERAPDVRYPEWDRGVALVLPRLYAGTDKRVLIGIGVDERNMREESIGGSSLRETREVGDNVEQLWSFQTGANYDALSALRLDFERYPLDRDETVEVTLIESRITQRPLGRWSVPVPMGTTDGIRFVLPQMIEHFSIGRGATDFLFKTVRPKGGVPLHQPRTFGLRVAAPGYQVVGRTASGCMTALSPELIADAQRDPNGKWARFITAVKDVR
jgi:hypothetical protein